MPPNNLDDLRSLRLQVRALERQIAALRSVVEHVAPDMSGLAYLSHFPVGTLYHITPAVYYAALTGGNDYVPETYAQDGFIHCTRGADLLAFVANQRFRAIPGDFFMLTIDERMLTAPVKYEALDPALPHPFPHIYGPLNRNAITEVILMPRAADGAFLVPPF